MTFKELELFYHLSEESHISQLANKINMSQSAVSLAIKSLEKKLGEPLFDRIGKKLVLNERGRFFKQETYSHFLSLKEAKNIFAKDKLSGVLKIASSKTIGNFILPQIIFDFLSTYESCTINNDTRNSAQIIQMVQEGKIDIGFIESNCNEIDIQKEKFSSDELIVVSSDKSLTKKSYYIDQLFDKKWLLREEGSGTRDIFLETISEISNELKVFMQYKDSQEIKLLLTKNKDAITCISKYVVENELEKKELYKIDIINLFFERDLFIVYHKNKYKSRLFKEFVSFVKEL